MLLNITDSEDNFQSEQLLKITYGYNDWCYQVEKIADHPFCLTEVSV